MLALDDAKALHAVAEECGHRGAVVLDLDVAEVAGGLVVVERLERHARAAELVPEARLRPFNEPCARSLSSSRADKVASDERATDTGRKAAHVATSNVTTIARDRGLTARPRSAPGSLGSTRPTIASQRSSNRRPSAKSRMAVMPFLVFLH